VRERERERERITARKRWYDAMNEAYVIRVACISVEFDNSTSWYNRRNSRTRIVNIGLFTGQKIAVLSPARARQCIAGTALVSYGNSEKVFPHGGSETPPVTTMKSSTFDDVL